MSSVELALACVTNIGLDGCTRMGDKCICHVMSTAAAPGWSRCPGNKCPAFIQTTNISGVCGAISGMLDLVRAWVAECK